MANLAPASVTVKTSGWRALTLHDQARADVFDDIERFYNPARRLSTLG